MNIFITTDTHFGHDKLVELCGRPQDFSEKIMRGLKAAVAPTDILVHLGDFCIGQDEKWHNWLMGSLPSKTKKWLIKGNHDRKSNHWYMEHGWDFVADSFRNVYFGKKIVFSHVPLADDGYDINFHGHFHNTSHRNHEPMLLAIKNPKQRLLALEYNNYQPWNLQTLIEHPEKYRYGE